MKAFTKQGKQVEEFLDVFFVLKSLTVDKMEVKDSVDKTNRINIVEINLPYAKEIYKISVYMKENKDAIVTGTVKFDIDFLVHGFDIGHAFSKSSLPLIKDQSGEVVVGFSTVRELKKIFNIVKPVF